MSKKKRKGYMGARGFRKYGTTSLSIEGLKQAQEKAKKEMALAMLKGELIPKEKI